MVETTEGIEREIRRLAAEHSSFYLYDAERIRRTIGLFTSIPYPNLSVNVATMANAAPAFLRLVKEERANIFVNSPMHLRACIDAGFSGRDIVYTSSAMDDDAMRTVHGAGVVVNLDSLGQVARWERVTGGARYGIRCNIGDAVTPRDTRGGYFIGNESRLGLIADEIRRLYGDERVAGLHLYAGTDILDTGYFMDCYREIIALAGNFPAIEYLDFGGGFGIGESVRHFDVRAFGNGIAELMNEFSGRTGRDVRLILEPGRLIAGEAGYFVCRVIDVKKRGKRRLLGVSASSVQFPRPLFYPDDAVHPVAVPGAAGTPVPTAVYGCSTYSRDYLARDVMLPEDVAEGDVVVFGNAGSYCASAHTAFLGFPPSPEFYVEV